MEKPSRYPYGAVNLHAGDYSGTDGITVHRVQGHWKEANLKTEQKGTKPGRQIKFECSDEFYQRLKAEKTRRNLTLQQLAIRALERYLALPESVHRRIDERFADPSLLATFCAQMIESDELRAMLNKYTHSIERVEPERALLALELRSLLEAIEGYLPEFPAEKLRLLEQELALDLKHYRSARIKPLRVFLDPFLAGNL